MGIEKKEYSYNISNIFLKFNQLLWRKPFLQRIRSLFYYIDGVLLLFCRKPKREVGRKKVLVVYNMAFGDGIMFYGVSKSLAQIYPKEEYDLYIACQKAFSQLYESQGIYSQVIPFDFSGAVVNLKNRIKLFKELRKEYYDIIVDPVGCEDCTTNVFVSRAVIGNKKIGVVDDTISHQMSERMRKKIYTDVVRISQPKIHLIEYYAEFFRRLGAVGCVAQPAELPHVRLEGELPEDFFIVFPVASMAVKKWNVENYAWISKKIQEKTGMKLLVCGTNHDRQSIEEMLSYIPTIDYVDMIGKTDLMQFTELIGRAKLVITNDTSAYHIAVARQVLTFMICGGYTFDRYANYQYAERGYKNPILITHEMTCYNCNNHCIHSGFKVFPCIDMISKEEALEKILINL